MSVLSYFDRVRIKSLEDILHGELIGAGMSQAILTDVAGNIIAQFSSGDNTYDTSSLSILAASNIGSLSAMSNIIGEDDFPLFILKGKRDNIHFTQISNDLFLITICNRNLSVGFVRRRIDAALVSIKALVKHCNIP